MGTRRFEQIDTSTGEISGSFVAVVMPKRKNGFGSGGWFAMAQGEALKTLRTAGLSGRDYEVLFALLEFLDFENLIQISQVELAAELNMRKAHVNRSIKRLIEIGAIVEGPKIGRSRSYRLNPNLGWKGSAKSHQSALRERMEARGLSVVSNQTDELSERDRKTIDWVNGKPDNEG